VLPEAFERQLHHLKSQGYHTITFADYLVHRRTSRPLPRRSIILTFDDGYRSNRSIAWPILKHFGFGATVFIVSGLLGETNAWDRDAQQEPLLTATDVQEMQTEGAEFGSHTRTHAHLTAVPAALARDELQHSRQDLEALCGKPVTVLGYPYSECNDQVKRLALDAGYEAAVIVRRRMNTDHTDLLSLRRIAVTPDTTINRFHWDLFRLRWFQGD
jgi:peptidoglycan/xylan/chitin deacetylase (PgdA/CDA1 family)